MLTDKVECPKCNEHMEVSVEHEDAGEGLEHHRTCDKCNHYFMFYISYEPCFNVEGE